MQIREIGQVVARLSGRHPELSTAQVALVVARNCERFADVPQRDFIPLLVERCASHDLAVYADAADESAGRPRPSEPGADAHRPGVEESPDSTEQGGC